jgi:hypothetical protein
VVLSFMVLMQMVLTVVLLTVLMVIILAVQTVLMLTVLMGLMLTVLMDSSSSLSIFPLFCFSNCWSIFLLRFDIHKCVYE